MTQDGEEYLQQQAKEGQLHSLGQFTLDQAKALEKMRRYQFSSPWQYLDLVVQAAVLRGADWVVGGIVDWRSRSIEIACRPLSEPEFDILAAPPDHCPPDLLQICLAAEAATRLGRIMVRRIEIESAGSVLHIALDGRRDDLQKIQNKTGDTSTSGIVFKVVDWVLSGVYLAAVEAWRTGSQYDYCGIPTYTGPKQELSTQHLRGAIPKAKGRQEIHRCDLSQLDIKGDYREVYFGASRWRADLIPGSASQEWPGQSWWIFEEPDQPGYSLTASSIEAIARVPWLYFNSSPAIGCWAYFVKTDSKSRIHWIKLGVVICTSTFAPNEFPAGWTGVVWANDLPTDLSGTKMVDGDAFRQRLHWLQAHLSIR